MSLLPVRLLAFPDEWLGSWLYMLAAENLPDHTPDPDRLLKALGITPSTQPLTDTQLATLTAYTGKTFEELQILATTPPDLIRDNGSSGRTTTHHHGHPRSRSFCRDARQSSGRQRITRLFGHFRGSG